MNFTKFVIEVPLLNLNLIHRKCQQGRNLTNLSVKYTIVVYTSDTMLSFMCLIILRCEVQPIIHDAGNTNPKLLCAHLSNLHLLAKENSRKGLIFNGVLMSLLTSTWAVFANKRSSSAHWFNTPK